MRILCLSFVVGLVVFLLPGMANGAKGQSAGIKFEKTGIEEVLTKAAKENKLVFMDFYTDTWGACTVLDQVVFQDNVVGNFVNLRFVSLKVDAAKGWGKEAREKYKVRGFPTVIIMTPQGGEIDRIVGFNRDKEKYLSNIKDYASGKNTLRKYLAEIKNNDDDITLNYQLAKKYISRYESDNAAPYYQKILTLDPENKHGYQEESECQVAIHEARANKNIKPLLEVMAKLKDQKLLQLGYSTLIRHYMREKDTKKVVATFEEAIKQLDDKISGLMELGFYYQGAKQYDMARDTFLRCLKIDANAGGAIYQLGRNAYYSGKNLEEGIAYLKKYLKYKPKPGEPEWADAFWRCGLILEKLGKKEEAIKSYQQALNLNAKHEGSLKELMRLKE